MTAIALERSVAGLSWQALLRIAALGQFLALAGAAIVLRDAEAAAIAVATLVGLLVLRFRGGTIGAIILGLVFADTAFFTGAAALTNLVDQAVPLAVIGPGALASIAMPGLVASVIAALRRSRASTPSRFAMMVPLLAVAGFAAVSVEALATGAEASAPASTVLQLEMQNVSYSLTQLEATGGTVTVRVTNHDLFWHTFTIAELGIDLKVPVGGHKEITFAAPPGAYTYLCSVPGHAAQMHGTLTVR